LLAVLRESLLASETPQIRSEAARRLVDLAGPEAMEAVIQAVQQEKDIEVLRAVLEAIASRPPEDRELRVRVARAVLPKVGDLERDVRLGAVNALGALKFEEAVPALLERLRVKDGDPDVVVAALEALPRIQAKNDPTVLAEINALLARELGRDPKDPLRDARILQGSANAIGLLARRGAQADPSLTEKSIELLKPLLAYDDPANAQAAAKTRQLAAIALGGLGLPVALRPLLQALEDKDEGVASYAAAAAGDVASAPEATASDRELALKALVRAFDGGRSAVKEAATDAIGDILKADVGNLTMLADFAQKLHQSGDFARLARLLAKVLPEKPPERPPQEAIYVTLRRYFAEALEGSKPPDLRAANEHWAWLAGRDPQWLEPYARSLASLGKYEEADKALADALAKTPPPADPSALWHSRLALVGKLVEAKAPDRALALAQKMLEPGSNPALEPPPAVRQELLRLRAELGAGPAPAAGGASPGSETAPPADPKFPPPGAGTSLPESGTSRRAAGAPGGAP